jgi:hypothetical protein
MHAAAVRREIKRLRLDIGEEELQAMLVDARRLKSREEEGTWALAAEEEENVRRRQEELAGQREREDDVNKMRGLRIRKARLRSVNRTRLRVCTTVAHLWLFFLLQAHLSDHACCFF